MRRGKTRLFPSFNLILEIFVEAPNIPGQIVGVASVYHYAERNAEDRRQTSTKRFNSAELGHYDIIL